MKDMKLKPYGNLALAMGMSMLTRGKSRRVAVSTPPETLSEVEAWNKAVDQAKAEKKAARLLKARLK